MLMKFDYQQALSASHGCSWVALERVITSFNLYYPKRSNFIARSRAKSCIVLIRRLRDRIDRRGK